VDYKEKKSSEFQDTGRRGSKGRIRREERRGQREGRDCINSEAQSCNVTVMTI
jgi:hypothetical protein